MGFEVVQNYSDAGFADLTLPAAEQKSDENPIGRLPRTWR
jgi:hypothetical protein